MESPHQVDMKNVVKWASDFFPYFEALYTNSVLFVINKASFLGAKSKEDFCEWTHVKGLNIIYLNSTQMYG